MTTMKAVLARVCQLEDTYWRDTFHDCLIAWHMKPGLASAHFGSMFGSSHRAISQILEQDRRS